MFVYIFWISYNCNVFIIFTTCCLEKEHLYKIKRKLWPLGCQETSYTDWDQKMTVFLLKL